MKKILLFLLLVSMFSACSKESGQNKSAINITDCKWYLTEFLYSGGTVNLKISGSTDGQKLTVRTFGDGVVSDENVELDAHNNFNKDIVIRFFITTVPIGEFEVTTKVMAYQGADTTVITLNSGKLKY